MWRKEARAVLGTEKLSVRVTTTRPGVTRPSAPQHPFAMSIANLSLRENWVGLESNPEVLTEYAHKMGVSKYGATASRRVLLFCRFLTFMLPLLAGAGALATSSASTRTR